LPCEILLLVVLQAAAMELDYFTGETGIVVLRSHLLSQALRQIGEPTAGRRPASFARAQGHGRRSPRPQYQTAVGATENAAEVANVQRMLVREHLDFLESDEHRARLTIRYRPCRVYPSSLCFPD